MMPLIILRDPLPSLGNSFAVFIKIAVEAIASVPMPLRKWPPGSGEPLPSSWFLPTESSKAYLSPGIPRDP